MKNIKRESKIIRFAVAMKLTYSIAIIFFLKEKTEIKLYVKLTDRDNIFIKNSNNFDIVNEN